VYYSIKYLLKSAIAKPKINKAFNINERIDKILEEMKEEDTQITLNSIDET